jgi:hypothetical protein
VCTIVVRHQLGDWCPTIIASNRDEFYDRPATAPVILRDDPRVVGGLDEREGGTWFGLTGDGLFVGLTNQRNFGKRDDALRSRGLLALEALEAGSLQGVQRYQLDLWRWPSGGCGVRPTGCPTGRDRDAWHGRPRPLQRSLGLFRVSEGRQGEGVRPRDSTGSLAADERAIDRAAFRCFAP